MALINIRGARGGSTAPYEPPPADYDLDLGVRRNPSPEPPPTESPFGRTGPVGPRQPRTPPPELPPLTMPTAFSGLNQNAIMNYLQTFGAPSSDALRQAFPGLLSQGLLPQGSTLEDSPYADEIFIPGVGYLDLLTGADTGAPSGWQYLLTQPGMGGMGGLGSYWSDPLLQQYTDFGLQAMQRLMQPQQLDPILGQAITRLQEVFGNSDAGYERFRQIAERRLGQLQSPLFEMPGGANTPDAMQNSALLRSKFVEPLQQQRAAAQQRALERAGARGLGLSSGLTEELAQQVDRQFDQQLTEGYRDLMLHEIAANEEREREAVGIGQLIASLAANPLQLSAAGQLAGIGQQLQGEELRNMMAALGISQGLAQMPLQQMMAAGSMLNTLGNQPVPQADPTTGLIGALLSLAGQGENVFNQALGDEGAFWQQLMANIPGLIDAFSGGQEGGG